MKIQPAPLDWPLSIPGDRTTQSHWLPFIAPFTQPLVLRAPSLHAKPARPPVLLPEPRGLLRQCIESFTRAVKFRAFFQLLKSVFGIGTSFGCTILRLVFGSDSSSNSVRA